MLYELLTGTPAVHRRLPHQRGVPARQRGRPAAVRGSCRRSTPRSTRWSSGPPDASPRSGRRTPAGCCRRCARSDVRCRPPPSVRPVHRWRTSRRSSSPRSGSAIPRPPSRRRAPRARGRARSAARNDIPRAARRRRRWWLVPIVLLLLVGLGVGAGYGAWWETTGQWVRTPSVLNLDRDAAAAKLTNAHLKASFGAGRLQRDLRQGRGLVDGPGRGRPAAQGRDGDPRGVQGPGAVRDAQARRTDRAPGARSPRQGQPVDREADPEVRRRSSRPARSSARASPSAHRWPRARRWTSS